MWRCSCLHPLGYHHRKPQTLVTGYQVGPSDAVTTGRGERGGAGVVVERVAVIALLFAIGLSVAIRLRLAHDDLFTAGHHHNPSG